MTSPKEVSLVLRFWFDSKKTLHNFPLKKSKLWFHSNPAFDTLLKKKFLSFVRLALKNRLNHWKNTPRGCLALILVLDQFSRNVYRNEARSFSGDTLALRICQEGLKQNIDLLLHPVERWFFYMPLMHAENRRLQKESVKRFRNLWRKAPISIKPFLKRPYDHAREHSQVIRQFGRFPHRNKILGRPSTAKEIDYLCRG